MKKYSVRYYSNYSIIFFIVYLASLCGQNIINSSAPRTPAWTTEPPLGRYYSYYTGMGISENSLVAAQKHAVTNILSSIIMESSVTVQSEIKTSILETIETTNGETEYSLIDKAVLEVIAKGESSTIENLSKEEEYWQDIYNNGKHEYRYWILMKIPKPEYSGLDPSMMTVKQSYGLSPIVKSVFVPGWGQIHKKEKKKGLILLTGFAVTLTAGIVSQSMSNNYAIDAQNADSGEWIDYHNTLSEQYYLASIISYILSGAMYSYNVYDAISSKGAKIYALNNDVGIYLTMDKKNDQIAQLLVSIDFYKD